jgi:FMN phosphatase YigB (HAD superfamily)
MRPTRGPRTAFFIDDKPENIAGARRLGLDAELFHGEADLRE